MPRSPVGNATVDAILGAVERILEREGVDRLTTNHVAEVAGVSIGSLYQYFPNKQSLLGALQDRYTEDTYTRVRAALEETRTEPIRTVILRIGAAVLAAKEKQRPVHRWLIDGRTDAGVWDRWRQSLDQHVELVTEYLSERTDIDVADARHAAFVLVHASEGLIEAVTERPDVDASRVTFMAVEMLARFVEKRPA